MAHHGVLLENEFENIYQLFSSYLNNPLLQKTKDDERHSFYMCKTYCLLSNLCRYIIVIIPKDNKPIDSQENLISLPWICLQTRTLPTNNVQLSHSYNPNRKHSLNIPIERIKITEDASIYSCEKLPLTITLLHTNKNTPISYQNKGNILAAIETYETIITKNK
jgi:hypothetical protein